MNLTTEESRSAALAAISSMAEGLSASLSGAGLAGASLSSRVKSPQAVQEKLERVQDRRINDFIGFRVVLPNQSELERAILAVRSWGEKADLEFLAADDRFAHPGLGGYRAVHLDFAISDPGARDLSPDAGIEVQLTTEILAAHAAACHKLVYRTDWQDSNAGLVAQLAELGEKADRLDRELALLASEA